MPQKIRCEVTEIIDHGEGVYSLFLKPASRVPRYLPGQFLHLAMDDYAHGDFWPDSRIFSIASSPTDRSLLRITYAVKGEFTSRMQRELRPGSRVWIKLAYGEFIVPSDRPVCLLAGGTGITAFTAFLGGLDGHHAHDIHLFYGARRPALLIYRPSVEIAAGRCPELHAHFLAEQDAEIGGCIAGRITTDTVFAYLPDPLAITYYLAGPPDMIHSLPTGLQERGVPANQVIIDAWD